MGIISKFFRDIETAMRDAEDKRYKKFMKDHMNKSMNSPEYKAKEAKLQASRDALAAEIKKAIERQKAKNRGE